MSGGLGKFREDIIALLRQENIPAIAAFEPEERKWLEEPTAVVSLARVTCTPGGFQNYLGTRTGADGQNEEWYGREAQLTVALDLYSPRTGGESACRQTMERMAEVLLSRGAGGLAVGELESGQVEFLESRGLYRLPVICRCRGWLAAAVRADGVFRDFEIRGTLR